MHARSVYVFCVIAPLLFCPYPAFSGMLEDFEQDFESIMTNFDDAKRSSDTSRLSSEFGKRMAKLEVDSRKIQEVITRLGIEDINLPQEVIRLRQTYLDRKSGRTGMDNRIGLSSGRWHPAHHLRRQIKALKDMEFSVENRSFNEAKRQPPDEFVEFEKVFNYCVTNVKTRSAASEGSHWKKDFEKKLSRLNYLGSRIQEKITRNNIDMQLATEVQTFVNAYKKISLSTGKRTSGALGGTSSDDDSDIGIASDKIRECIITLKDMNFVYDEVRAKREAQEAETEGSAEDASVNAEEASGEKTYSQMSRDQLFTLLQNARDNVYRSDKRIGGLESDTVEKYRKTLTSSQLQELSALMKKYGDRGYSKRDADSSAVMEMHGKLRNRSDLHPKEEIIKLLQRLDQEAQKAESPSSI